MSAEVYQKKTLDQNQDRRKSPVQETPNLDRRYGRIGIEAVAAALRYSGTTGNAVAQKSARIEDRFIEIAA